MEKKLEELILHPPPPTSRPVGAHLGRITYLPAAAQKYRDFILRAWPKNLDLRGLRLALDTANGAACETAPELLRELGAELFLFHHEPNGININMDCGSTHPQFIQRETKLCQAQAGFAFDGDADRLICCDEHGAVVDGDEIMAILTLDFLQAGTLPQKTLVATTQSNLGLDECVEKAGGRVIRTEVGDRHVLAAMLEQNLAFGGEQSGHIIFRDILPTSDGLLTALQILRIIKQTGQPLSVLRQCLRRYPQVQINLLVREKRPLAEMPKVQAVLQSAKEVLGAHGRINFRYSGTENKARLLLEGSNEPQLHALGAQIADALKLELGS
jgi:phosphoglucosamine mutase